MILVVGHPVQTVSVMERGGTRQLETTLDLVLHKGGGTLESAIRVLLIDRLVVTQRVLAALQHGHHEGNQLGVEVAAVVGVGHGLIGNRSASEQ